MDLNLDTLEKNMEKKIIPSTQRINASTLLTYSILTFVLFFAYILEFVKGSRTLAYTFVFSLLDLAPYISCCLLYKRNRQSPVMKYVMAVGFSFLYAFVLLTAAVPTTFVYIFLVFIMVIPYGDLKLCFITGGISILSNIISVVVNFANGSLTTDDLAIVEIQVLSVILSALFSTLATKVNGKVSNQRIAQINAEKEKINAIISKKLV